MDHHAHLGHCPNFGMGNKIIFSIFDFWEKLGNFYF
jgi:hypothetical protein